MPEPERHTPVSAPRPVQAGLGVEDIRHIPVQKRELRFTRNRAGAILTAAGVLLAATAAFLQLTGYDTITPYLPAPLWAMQAAALVPAVLCLTAGCRCLKHAAVIVTPVGVEILPFLRARRAMQWFFWQQIRSADREGGRLNLRLADGSTAAISLRPMTAASQRCPFQCPSSSRPPAGTCWPMRSASASTPCNLPAMVRPEKLAALRERMEALGIREQDLEESFVRGSGRGGQKVNKTNNCVYLRHTPTGIAVKCHADRSRELNRFLARRELCDAVEQMQTGRCAAKARVIQRMRKQKDRRRRRRSAPAPSPPDSE